MQMHFIWFGKHKEILPYDGIIEDLTNDLFFGVIVCDITVPDVPKERDYFSEMQPIFKNIEIKYDDVSDETKEQIKENYKSRKLIGSYFGTQMMFHTDLLKWYLKKGLVVSNITRAVRYEKKAPFKKFAENVSNARRQGDKCNDYKLIGDMMKLLGNSSYGKTITNFLKHDTVKIVSNTNYDKNLRKNTYKTHEDLINGYEFSFRKNSHRQNLPIQIGFAVYQLAKLRMLELY